MPLRRQNLSAIEPVMSKDIYKLYREYKVKKKVPKKGQVSDIKELRKAVDLIFTEIRNTVVESDSGVCIDKLGYFFVYRSAKKVIYTMQPGEEDEYLKYGKYSGKRAIIPLFLPYYNVSNRALYGWSMDYTFTSYFCQLLDEKLKAGKKYKCYPHTLKKLKRI